MNSLVHGLNVALTALFDLLLFPFRSLSPIWGLTVVSLLAGILMLWIFGKVSDQATIRVVRDRIRGNLIGIRLFGDDLGTLFRLQVRLLRDNLIYMKYALIPMVILIVPVIFILIQLNLRFSTEALDPGRPAVVNVTLSESGAASPTVDLDVPAGVVVESPPVRIDKLREISWRIRANDPGRYKLTVRAGGESEEKELLVGQPWGATSPLRTAKPLHAVGYPGEPPLPASGAIEAIEVRYGTLPLRVFGWNVHWLIVFFVVSLAAGFAFRGTLGVEI